MLKQSVQLWSYEVQRRIVLHPIQLPHIRPNNENVTLMANRKKISVTSCENILSHGFRIGTASCIYFIIRLD